MGKIQEVLDKVKVEEGAIDENKQKGIKIAKSLVDFLKGYDEELVEDIGPTQYKEILGNAEEIVKIIMNVGK